MLNQPKISIIVPCYNQAHFLDECVASLIKQTYDNWECILVNDGSTDNTAPLGQAWAKKDSRIIYSFKQNGGLSSARNHGLKLATGDFIQFLDCDDYLYPEKFAKSVAKLNEQAFDMVISNFLLFDERKQRKMPPYCVLKPELFNYNSILMDWDKTFTIPVHCALVARSLIGENLFIEDLKAKEDWFFWLKMYQQNPKVCFVDEELVFLRFYSGSMTKQYNFMAQQQLNAFDRLEAIIDYPHLYKSYLEHNTRFYIQETNRLKQLLLLANEKRKLRYIVQKIKNWVGN
jgi:hypothetical protein